MKLALHYKSNTDASTVSHTENCLYQLEENIKAFGSEDQKALLQGALDMLESLYYTLREDE